MATFNDAVSALLFSQPFFGTLLMKMQHVEDRTLNPPTACVNGREVRYHPDFFDKLTLDEAVFVVAHEVMHLAWMHLPRLRHYLRQGAGPDGKPLDTRLFNMAMDYPVNASLTVAKVGVMPKLGCLDMQRFPAEMSPEEVYIELRKDQKKGKEPKGEAMDGHEPGAPEGADGEDLSDAITPADVLQAANTHKAIRGELPAGMDRLLGELKKPAQSPWAILRQFTTSSLPGHDATTWRRLQRRPIVRGIGMPGPVQQGAGHIGIVVDTSGSIDQRMLDLFGGHMAAIMDDARPVDVKLYWTDAKVHRVDTVKTSSDLRRVLSKKVPGGGGTDMICGVRAAETDKCDAIIVLTDGYCDFTSSVKPLMWAITTTVRATGNGRTIHIS
jgi:predicted metal-dependent peptidase